jgi:hypothetical protein
MSFFQLSDEGFELISEPVVMQEDSTQQCARRKLVFDHRDGECAFICVCIFHAFSSASAGVLVIKSSSLRVLDVHAIMGGVIGNCSRFVCQ